MDFDMLLVDDNILEYKLIMARLEMLGQNNVDIRYAPDLAVACVHLADREPDLLLLDNRLPPVEDYRHSVGELRRAGYDGPIVVASASLDDSIFEYAADLGVDACIEKLDLTTDRLLTLIDEYSPAVTFDQGAAIHCTA